MISISYGGGETDLPAYYIKRQCDEIMKLALQGVTVVTSSGDYGVGSSPGDGGFATAFQIGLVLVAMVMGLVEMDVICQGPLSSCTFCQDLDPSMIAQAPTCYRAWPWHVPAACSREPRE